MHLANQGVEFMQFAFRWMNCLLMREISVQNTIRMWDTYLVRLFFPFLCVSFREFKGFGQSEGTDAFSQFHLYVCSAFLVRWSQKLRQMDFQVGRWSLTKDVALITNVGNHHVSSITTYSGLA